MKKEYLNDWEYDPATDNLRIINSSVLFTFDDFLAYIDTFSTKINYIIPIREES